jgi:hypothetical protein
VGDNRAVIKGIANIYMYMYCRLAADIVPGRLESAKLVGADITINCKEENLKDRGSYSRSNDNRHRYKKIFRY